MAFSYKNYQPTDNITDTFSIPFTFTAQSEISVTVNGVAETGLTFPSSSTVQLTSPVAAGSLVQVRRTTALAARSVDFASGSVLTEEDLDNSAIQTFHASQEAIDKANDSIFLDSDDKWEANSKVIKNLATPTSANDATTKSYVDTGANNAAASAVAAAASEASALASKNAAASSATSATNSANSATNSATSATNSATSATNSATSATNSATSATNSANSATISATSAADDAADSSKLAVHPHTTQYTLSDGITTGYSALHYSTEASTSATQASNSAIAASSSSSSATDAFTDAQKIAVEPYNTQYTLSDGITTGYSSLHYSTTASNSATSAASSATSSSNSATSASSSAGNASSSASAASGSANSASSSASAALSSANAASGSASAASSSASQASGYASQALSYKNSAQTSSNSAASSASSAAASYDSFDDRYLGVKTSDPSVDNDGDALLTGALYYDSTASAMKVYDGSTWGAAYIPTSGYAQLTGATFTGDITVPNLITAGNVDGRDVSVDGTKLDGIEANATADQTGAEIKSAYEAEADTNAFTDAEKTKLTGIETGADVTDTTNVTAAGALMDSEVTNLAQVKAFNSADYATAAQGTLAANALPASGGTMTGTLTLGANVINDVGDIYLRDKLIHDADTDTYFGFSSNTISLVTGGSTGLVLYQNYLQVYENVVGAINVDTNQGTGIHTPDFQNYNSFVWTLTGNITLGNPTTEIAGMSGVFIFTHSGAGRTVSLQTDYETAGAAGLTLSSTAGAVDIVPYFVKATGSILLGTPMLAFS